MRYLAAGLLCASVLVTAACHDSVGEGACFDAGVEPYAFHAPGDTTAVFRWTADFLPVRVWAEPRGATATNVDTALQLWANAFRCGELWFQRVADSTTADVLVLNPDWMPPQLTPGIVVAADSTTGCSGRTDVALDVEGRLLRPIHSWVTPFGTDSVAMAACFRIVTAHELGHAIGLFSHSADPGDLMHYRPPRRALSDRDRYTVQLLYHTTPTIGLWPR